MAKTRKTYGWGCLPCNMQCGGMPTAEDAWDEAATHTNSSGHVTDTFYRTDVQITTIYPNKRDLKVLTSVQQQVMLPDDVVTEDQVSDPGERSGPSAQETIVDPALGDFTPEAVKAMDKAVSITDKYLKEEKEGDGSAKTKEPSGQVS